MPVRRVCERGGREEHHHDDRFSPHGQGCYYARLKDASGAMDSIIANNCGTWTKVG